MSAKCVGLTKAGKPCGNFAVHGSDYCIAHVSKETRKELWAKKLEPRALLEEQLRKVRQANANPLERARLILDIEKFLRELDDNEPAPENRPEPDRELTPAEKVAALRKKRV